MRVDLTQFDDAVLRGALLASRQHEATDFVADAILDELDWRAVGAGPGRVKLEHAQSEALAILAALSRDYRTRAQKVVEGAGSATLARIAEVFDLVRLALSTPAELGSQLIQ